MSQKLDILRDDCTEKQQRFVKLYKDGEERIDAFLKAGYKAKTRQQAAINAHRLLTKCNNVIVYLSALKADEERKTGISRTLQLNKLNKAYDIAAKQQNPSAMTGAVREQNEMLGYHRENAPNEEREQARKALKANELTELERLSRARTEELSHRPVIRQIGA